MIHVTLLLLLLPALLTGSIGGPRVLPQESSRQAVECRPRGGLPNVLARLRAGQETRIAYLGGSITAQEGWRPKTLAWFRQQYPRAHVSEINAAIGGTGSDLGVYRLRHDVLRFKPHLLYVEFAVNDSGSAPERIRKAMEGIVRQTWRADPTTDICFVYALTEGMLAELQSGKYPRAAGAMEEVADRYGIPSIHMGLEVARLQQAGKVIFRAPMPTAAERAAMAGKLVFSGDGVHPYPETGHALYLDAIVRSMAEIGKVGRRRRHALPAPLEIDNWERAKLLPFSAAHVGDGWQKLDPARSELAKRFEDRMPELWKADRAGATIEFKFRGTACSVYDLLGPDCGQVSVQLDNRPAVMQARFDSFSNYHRLATLIVAEGLPNAVHSVKIRTLAEPPDKLKILHLRAENAGIIQLDPAVYGGTAWYAGALLILGELVP